MGNRGRSNQDLLRRQQRPGSRPTRYLTPGRSNRSSATTAGRPVGSRYNRSNVQSQNERPVSVSRRFNPSNRANNNSSVTPRPPQNVKINKRRANNATQTNQTRPANNSTNNRRQNTRPQTFSRPSSGVRSSSSGRGGRGGRRAARRQPAQRLVSQAFNASIVPASASQGSRALLSELGHT